MTSRTDPSASEHGEPIVTETTALLTPSISTSNSQKPANGSLTHTSASDTTKPLIVDKPLPKAQIFWLCYARLTEPIAFFCIFPIVSQMIWDTGTVKESDVGFYSGLIESLFSLTQVIFFLPWGRLADHPKIGRKPVLVCSLIGVGASTAMFGMSKTIWQMILCRCIAGASCGILVTIRTMFSENSTPKTQARVFSFFAVTQNIGITLGPLLGGALVDPAHTYPRVFGRSQFLRNNPYALPTIVAGSVGLSAAVTTQLFVKETLKAKISKQSVNSSTSDDDGQKMSAREVIMSPGVLMVLYLNFHLMILAFGYTAVVPVFWFTPIRLGGFSFPPQKISLFMGITGAAQGLWLLIAFPYLQRRFSTGAVLRGCGIAYPFFFLVSPINNFFLRQGWTGAFWATAPFGYALGSGVSMAFTAIQLAINDINPTPLTLGTLNAVALMLSSTNRAISPAIFTSVFAFGVRKQILNGYLAWVILGLIALGFTFASRFLPKKAEGRLRDQIDEEGS